MFDKRQKDGSCMVEADEDVKKAEESLTKASNACKRAGILIKVVFLLLCCWWCASVVVMGLSVANPGYSDNPVTPIALINFIFCGLAMVIICVTLIQIFSDASKGRSPFTLLQVRRLRLVSATLLAYAVLEFGMTLCASFMQQDSSGFPMHGTPTLNLFPIVAAAVVFAFSFVFKYGVLLQEFSDDTL